MPADPASPAGTGDGVPSEAGGAGGAGLDTRPGLDTGAATAAAGLLAHWWSRPVAGEVGEWLAAAGNEEDIRRLIYRGAAPVSAPLSPRDHDSPALLDEYERLFVGPAHVPCPPYESFWREDVPIDLWGSLMGPCTAELRTLYRALEIEVAPAAGELEDHVAVEFEALAYALARSQTYPVARAIFSNHLEKWLPRLCRAVSGESGQPFYADLAATTLDWLGYLRGCFDRAAA